MVLNKRTYNLCTNLRAIAAPQFGCLTMHFTYHCGGVSIVPTLPYLSHPFGQLVCRTAMAQGGFRMLPTLPSLGGLCLFPAPPECAECPTYLHCSSPITDRHTQPMQGMGFLSRPACSILLVGSILSLFWKPPSSYHAIWRRLLKHRWNGTCSLEVSSSNLSIMGQGPQYRCKRWERIEDTGYHILHWL